MKTVRLGDGTIVDAPMWESLNVLVDAINIKDLLIKISHRRGVDIDVELSGCIFMKNRAGLAIFSHLAPKVDETLFALRNHELWKNSGTWHCQGCGQGINDHHFAFGDCTPKLPKWSDLEKKLTSLADAVGIPVHWRWWSLNCKTTPKTKGCPVHPALGRPARGLV